VPTNHKGPSPGPRDVLRESLPDDSGEVNERERGHPAVDSRAFWLNKKCAEHQEPPARDGLITFQPKITERLGSGGREGPNVSYQALTHDRPLKGCPPCQETAASE
jgi:hypothetical protein